MEDLEIDDGRRRQQRRRAILPPDVSADDKYSDPGGDSTIVMVNGLDPDSTVLDLKSRTEMYGSVARIRIDSREGVGYVRYRTPDQALSAIAASENHLPSVTFGNPKVRTEIVFSVCCYFRFLDLYRIFSGFGLIISFYSCKLHALMRSSSELILLRTIPYFQ